MKNTYKIPKGCTSISIEQIEDLKVEPKVGDCVKCTDSDDDGDKSVFYFVCGGFDGDGDPMEKNYCRLKDKEIQFDCVYFGYARDGFNFQILTPTQFQSEVNALGFDYDFNNDTFKELRWVPKEGERCFFICVANKCELISNEILFKSVYHLEAFERGFVKKTKSECESAIEKIKNVLKSK